MERPWTTRLAIIVGALTIAVGLAACTDDSNAGSANNLNIVNNVETVPETTAGGAATERFEIEIANFQFGPAEAVVPAGTEVVWLNNDTDVHSIISTGDLFASSSTFANGESYAVVFTEPGTYAYICGVHPFMTGTITVQ